MLLSSERLHVNADLGNDCTGSRCTDSINAAQLLHLQGKQSNIAAKRFFEYFINRHPVNTCAFHNDMAAGPVRIHATILSLWTSSPQGISRRSFIQSISFAIEWATDLPEVIRTLLLVLTIKGATICCAQGQNIYVDKRGADPPRCVQT